MLARVEALIADARARGLVEVSGEAAPYVAPDDPRVREHLPIGPGWARYTVVLGDGAVVLEGGARRVWLVPPDRGAVMVRDAARAVVEGARTLHQLLVLHRSVSCGGPARSAVERAIQDEGLLPRLEERIRERAAAETQRLDEPELLDRLLRIVPDDALRRRLTGDRSLPPEVLAGVGVWPARPDPAATLEAAAHERLAGGERGLDASVTPALDRAVDAVDGGERWWTRGAVLPDGTILLDGGARRLRVALPDVAERLVAEALDRAVADPDLRVLLHHRARSLDDKPGTDLHRALGGSTAAREGLDARIRALAPAAQADPPLGAEAAAMLQGAGVPDAEIRRLRHATDLPPEQLAQVAQRAAARPREVTAAERLDALLAERTAAGFVELREDAPRLADGDDVAEQLPLGPGRLAAILADGSIHVESGTTRTRLCPPAVARAIVQARVDDVLRATDLRLLLHVAALASAGGSPGSSLERLGSGRARAQLLRRIGDLAGRADVRLHRRRDRELLSEAGVAPDVIERLFGVEEQAAAREAASAAAAARREAEAERTGRLEALLNRAAGWAELHEDVVPYLEPGDPSIAEDLPTGGAPGLRHAALLRDGSLHLEGGATRVRLLPRPQAAKLLDAAGRRALERGDLFQLLELAVRAKHGPPPLSLAGWVAATPARGRELLQRVGALAGAPDAPHVSRRVHAEILQEAGVPAEVLEAVGAAARPAPPPPTAARPPAGDRLAELLADRAGKGWVELHEDAAPFVADDEPSIAERLPPRAAPWTRLVAVLDDGSVHLEGGLRRVRLCAPAVATKLLDRAARRVAASDDLLELLELAVRARRHPPRWTLAHHVASSRRSWEGLLARIRDVAADPRWEGRVHRRAWQEILDAAGVDAVRRLLLEGAILARGAEDDEAARARRARSAAEQARARLLDAVADRLAHGWVAVPSGAVPYVDAADPRVRELFRDPDGVHRFAAILEDGTIVHEGGVTRWWLVPPERSGAVVERHAWETARGGPVHGLLELLIAARGEAAATHPLTGLLAARDDLRREVEERVAAAVRDGRHRFTRPRHRELLRSLGLLA